MARPLVEELTKPHLDAVCPRCGEACDAYEPCCGDLSKVDGNFESREALIDLWCQETGLRWEDYWQ